jgi:hypothetical protein
MRLTSEQYKTMCEQLRTKAGKGIADTLIKATQKAFGTVDTVTAYHAKGLVCFADGKRYIFNFNGLYPTFYRVDIQSYEYVKAYKA